MRKLFAILFVLGLALGCKPGPEQPPPSDQTPIPALTPTATPVPGLAVCKEHPPGDDVTWQCRDALAGYTACPSEPELDALKYCQ